MKMNSTEVPSEARGEVRAPSIPAPTAWGKIARLARRYGLQLGITGVALFVWLLFLIGNPEVFTSYPIYNSFMSTTPFFAIMALPLTMVIIAGEIDLSFPSIMSFGMTAFTVVFVNTQSTLLAFLACLLAGVFAGWLNGIIVVKGGVPSLVATIGTQFFWRGAVLVITAGNGLGLTVTQKTIFHEGVVGRIGGVIPGQMAWTIVIAIVVWFVLNRSRFGAHVYLVGDNVESARLMGVNVGRTKILTFTIMGLAAAFAGYAYSMELLYYWPTLGEGQFLSSLASVFLGGTSVFGGTGTVFGTFVASFIIGSINAGIVAGGLTGFWTNLIYGLIIVVSVLLQAVIGRRLARSQ
jgi:simple sugar transport system permease protein